MGSLSLRWWPQAGNIAQLPAAYFLHSRSLINSRVGQSDELSSMVRTSRAVFETVHDESVKVYRHMYNGNVQQKPLCVESCVSKDFFMSPFPSSTVKSNFAY